MTEPAAAEIDPGAARALGAGRLSRWYIRVPVKWAIFAIVTFFVLFPNPVQLVRHLSHLRDMQAMIDPHAPELDAWALEILHLRRPPDDAATSSAPRSRTAVETQREVERFVLEKVKYEWDWNLWGSADYMPTVGEIFALAKREGDEIREDCDGRAIVAASLMKRLGYTPSLVTDLRHVWVETPEGRWMGPGEAKTVVSTPEGNKVRAGTLLANLPISLSYGVAVFPLAREMIILVTAFLLMRRRGTSWRASLCGLILLIQGLLFMRLGFFAPRAVSREVSSWPAWAGVLHLGVGLAVLWIAGARSARSGGQVPARVP